MIMMRSCRAEKLIQVENGEFHQTFGTCRYIAIPEYLLTVRWCWWKMTVNQLTYFTVTGHWYDVEAPDTSGSTNKPQFLVVSAFVTFTPRLAPGTSIPISNLDLGYVLNP